MKPIWDMTDAEMVSDDGLEALDAIAVTEGLLPDDLPAENVLVPLCEAVPLLTAEIRRLRDHVHEIAQEIAERLVEEDEDDFEPGPPVYGPLTLMEQLTRDLSRDLAEQLYAGGPTRMEGLSATLDALDKAMSNLRASPAPATQGTQDEYGHFWMPLPEKKP